jgi:hypothetical protein
LREESRLRVFENRMLRRIFGFKMDEVKREWRRLYNEELNDLYSSPNIVRVIKIEKNEMGEHVARIEEVEMRIQGLHGETRGKETTWETQA